MDQDSELKEGPDMGAEYLFLLFFLKNLGYLKLGDRLQKLHTVFRNLLGLHDDR